MGTSTRHPLAYTLFAFIVLSSFIIWNHYREVSQSLENALSSAALQFNAPPMTEASEIEQHEPVTEDQVVVESNEQVQTIGEKNWPYSGRPQRIPNSVSMMTEERRDWDPDNLTEAELEELRSYSSVDYFSCCGLGHRLSKNADAYYISRLFNVSLRVYWGFCDEIDVAHFLFKPQPPWQMPLPITSFNHSVRLHNEVWGFRKLIREGPNVTCKCTHDKFLADVDYYRGIQERFRFRATVDDFRKRAFANHTVIGMHIRAGNNETGDFQKKNRGIHDLDGWMKNMVKHLQELGSHAPPEYPPLLYIATDTSMMVQSFREYLKDIMPVVDFPQQRAKEGEGVMFGARGHVNNEGRTCLVGWVNAMLDMMLLSHADVVVAARPSSFVQTMPMILAYAQSPETRVYDRPFCEVNSNATDVRCFQDFMEWCCESLGTFFFPPMNQRYDYLRVPYNIGDHEYKFRERPVKHAGPSKTCQPTKKAPNRYCLSYDFPEQNRRVKGMELIR